MRQHAEQLQAGHSVQFRPRGNSMQGKIESGQLVTVMPSIGIEPKLGDIVLCRVKGNYLLHLISAVGHEHEKYLRETGPKRYQISNNKGRINGWINRNAIFGKVVRIEP